MAPAALLLALGACAGRRGGAGPAAAPAPDGVRAAVGSEPYWVARASEIRGRLLAAADWSDVGEDACKAGTLRTFSRDTTAGSFARTNEQIVRLERMIIAHGVDTPIDTPDGHELVRTLVGWEAGETAPRWDVDAPPGGEEPDRRAIAPGLAGEFRNPQTGKCEALVAVDTLTIVLPPLTGFTPPRTSRVVLDMRHGPEGLRQAREDFYAAKGRDPGAIFTYTRVGPVVIWNDLAVVTVNRPAEARGVMELKKGAGGATNIFRRVGREWRLLVVSRTWS